MGLFIPEDQLKPKLGTNLTPMIDFVFLMLAFFASLTITRVTIKDAGIDLVKVGPVAQSESYKDTVENVVSISIAEDGQYKWLTEYHEIIIPDAELIGNELLKQFDGGLLSSDKAKTQVLLQIDRNAKWSSISNAIFAIRDVGFEVHPVYQPDFAKDSH